MTDLARILARRIAAQGPMTLADYMASCLLDPDHGYYATRDPFGAAGDFTTAPEISQMFGEMLGLCLAQAWMDQGRPTPFVLAELGPGRGTLMADMLRAMARAGGADAAAEVHLVEASATLRARQADTLAGREVNWHDTVDSLPDAPLFLVANEFFDALPIRQFRRTEKGWAECHVGLSGGNLTFGLGDPLRYGMLDHRLSDTRPGDTVEHCPAAGPIAEALGHRIARQGGVALIIDYGDWHSLGDTFQALRRHKPEHPLAQPGAADLTAHVDFEPIAHGFAAAGCGVSQLTPQGVFLERLGITPRAQSLAQGLEGPALSGHIAAHRRLTHPDEMGLLFKVLACFPKGKAVPAGLEPA